MRVVARGSPVAADREARFGRVALAPPAVEDRTVDDAVQRCLHAGRPRRFERPARVVQPHVDALHEIARERHLVVGQEDDTAVRARDARELDERANQLLAALICRMGFACENELEWTLRIRKQACEAVVIADDQVGALVRREAAREADRERIGIERLAEAA